MRNFRWSVVRQERVRAIKLATIYRKTVLERICTPLVVRQDHLRSFAIWTNEVRQCQERRTGIRSCIEASGLCVSGGLRDQRSGRRPGQMKAPAVVSHRVRTMFIRSSILRTMEARRELRLCSILTPVKKVRTNSAREQNIPFVPPCCMVPA